MPTYCERFKYASIVVVVKRFTQKGHLQFSVEDLNVLNTVGHKNNFRYFDHYYRVSLTAMFIFLITLRLLSREFSHKILTEPFNRAQILKFFVLFQSKPSLQALLKSINVSDWKTILQIQGMLHHGFPNVITIVPN